MRQVRAFQQIESRESFAALVNVRPFHFRLISKAIALIGPPLLFLSGTASSQAPSRTQQAAALVVGGYRIALGMPISEVNAGLGFVLQARLNGSDKWDYMQGDDLVASVRFTNGRVSQVFKFYSYEYGNTDSKQLRAIGEASEEFAQIAKGYPCSRMQPDRESGINGVLLDQQCGPFSLRINVYKVELSEGESALGIISVIVLGYS